jgi:GNAT superfamily N-acetyltransferase
VSDGAAAGVWFGRHTAPEGGLVYVGVLGSSFPDGTVVDLPWPPVRPAGWQGEAYVPAPGRLPSRVLIGPDTVPGAPHLWVVPLQAGDGDQVDLVAFSTADFADGDVVGRAAFERLGLGWGDQVGAVRWSPSTGLVSQIYVTPRFRRRGVAVKLLNLAGGIRAAMGWAPLRTDGRFTDLGAAWLRGAPEYWQDRIPDRTAQLPPMTPPEEAVGVPARNLVPDPA